MMYFKAALFVCSPRACTPFTILHAPSHAIIGLASFHHHHRFPQAADMPQKLPDLLGKSMEKAKEAWADSKEFGVVVQRGNKWLVAHLNIPNFQHHALCRVVWCSDMVSCSHSAGLSPHLTAVFFLAFVMQVEGDDSAPGSIYRRNRGVQRHLSVQRRLHPPSHAQRQYWSLARSLSLSLSLSPTPAMTLYLSTHSHSHTSCPCIHSLANPALISALSTCGQVDVTDLIVARDERETRFRRVCHDLRVRQPRCSRLARIRPCTR